MQTVFCLLFARLGPDLIGRTSILCLSQISLNFFVNSEFFMTGARAGRVFRGKDSTSLTLTGGSDEAAEGVVLADAVGWKNGAMHNDMNSRLQKLDGEKAFGQVLQAVAAFKPERRHRAREERTGRNRSKL